RITTPTVPNVFSYTVFSKRLIICSGFAFVVISQSFGSFPINRSRTHPPTRYASKPAFSSVYVTCETSLGILKIKLLLKFLDVSISILCTRRDSNPQRQFRRLL